MAKFFAVVLCLTTSLTVFAGDKSTNGAAKVVPGSKVYIEKMNGFETYSAAAFAKKKVQLIVVRPLPAGLLADVGGRAPPPIAAC